MTLIAAAVLLPALASPARVEARLAEIEARSQGKLGAAIITPSLQVYHRKGQRFSLQSVMKLMVAMAAMNEVDQGRMRLDQKFTFHRSDLSVSWQPLADRLGKRTSMTVTVAECIEETVTMSCSASGDFLIRKMGGVHVVNRFLRKHGITGLSVDRQERDLQTNIVGLKWKPEYIDEAKLEADERKVSAEARDAAYRRYLGDVRDTTTPEAMGQLLQKLVTGKLLSRKSTQYLMGVMERTQTGPDRLKAGVQPGWILGHKTGTSSTHKGLAGATNDVGYVRRGNGDWIVIVALLRSSTLNPDGRAGVLRQVAEAAFLGVPEKE